MKTKTPKKIKPARVTSISVSKLYNLGNYQNVSYHITSEVPKGASAKATLCQLVHVLQMLKPLPRPQNADSLKWAEEKMETDLSNYEKENMQAWRDEKNNFEALKAARYDAVNSLDALGGTSVEKDAKRVWNDDEALF
jgi:hypothetical protein